MDGHLAVSWICGKVAGMLGQPRAVGEIAWGILLGPSALGVLWPAAVEALFPAATQDTMQVLAKLGLILLMFQVGMEFDFKHLETRSHTVTAIAVMGLAAIHVGLELKLLNRELFAMFVLMALLTTVMTGPLLRLWLPPELRALSRGAGGLNRGSRTLASVLAPGVRLQCTYPQRLAV